MSLPDAVARRRIREDLTATLVVEAAAGTGKTTELVARIVAAIETGHARLGDIVAVTFTEKAAGEMKLRLRGAIESARAAANEERAARLAGALAELEAARIGTIHSFCADLLHEHPVEARVDPVFEVTAQDEGGRLLDQAFDAWRERALADPPEGVRRALRRRMRDRAPSDALRDAVRRLADHRDFTARWSRPPFDRTDEMDRLVVQLEELGKLASLAERTGDYLWESLIEVQRFVEELHHREGVRGRDHDGLEAELRELGRSRKWGWRGREQRYGSMSAGEVREQRTAVKEALDRVVEACDADLAACLQLELEPVITAYEELKRQGGKLDFLDLLVRARDLVRDQPEVRAELQQRFSHLFVDEFQDTDPLQAEILLLLAADDPAQNDWTSVRPRPGKLFVVGDPKQSVYRFRRADVALYQRVKQQLAASGGEIVFLTTSFRSTPAIQGAVNAAIGPLMKGLEYVPLMPFRADVATQPSIVALSVPRPYADSGRVTKWRVEESTPDCVGAFVDWLVNASGWTVTERDDPSARVPVMPRHVCLLLKRFQSFGEDITRGYVRALETRRVPHVLVGGRSFHQREEVLALHNALSAIEWPDDELSVYSTLRGPFFAIHDEALFAYRSAHGRLHPLHPHPGAGVPRSPGDVGAALDVIGLLHRGRNRRPIADTLARLLDATRAHAGIAIWPHGEQALANVLRMMDLARRFEAQGATSFRAFVDRLDEDAERGEAAEAPVVEEGTEGVRIMTVHRAKGLEFPVVILCEPSAPPTWSQPSRYVSSSGNLWAEPLAGCMPHELLIHRDEALRGDEEEAVRLAYVAATRARDLLVVPAVGDEPVDGWLDVLRSAIYPRLERCRRPGVAAGCPKFGEDSVLDRPSSSRFNPVANVAPGLHEPIAGAHGVVWWDPRALDLDREHDVGLRQETILVADESGAGAQIGEQAHARWRARREAALARGKVATHATMAVTQWSQLQPPEQAPEVIVERTDASRDGRPRGKRFGTLVHAALATVSLDAGDADARAACDLQGRLIGAPAAEVEAASAAVMAAIAHPLLRRAAASDACRREAPIMLRLDEGSLLEGSVDLAFREPDGWTVIDFKTDAELGELLAPYRHQVALYARAITAATGEPARGVILSV